MRERLVADQLKGDPRVDQAKKMLLSAVQDYQKQMTHVRPPNQHLQIEYQQLLDQFAQYRGGKLWFPFLGSGIGNGALVELADGSVKYDFISGIGVHAFGHSHPKVIESSLDAAISDTVMQGHLQQNVESVELSRLLLEVSGMEHCFLTSSGAMANENGIKIAFQKRAPANRILAFEKGFAGRTHLLAQITDKPQFRQGLPASVFVDYIPFFEADDPKGSTRRAVERLEHYLKRYPRQYALMMFELVQGEGGFYSGDRDFFVALMEVLKQHQVTILADEIQTFGRTDRLFAFQHFGLESYVDIVTIGKMSQVCATLFHKDHLPRPGLLSQTFTGSTAAIRAGKVMLEMLLQGNFFGKEGKNQQIHQQFSQHLARLAEKYPGKISGPYGIGAMVAFTPFDGEETKTKEFTEQLFQEGVIGFVAGSDPTRIRFLVPAVAISEIDITNVIAMIENVILKMSSEE